MLTTSSRATVVLSSRWRNGSSKAAATNGAAIPTATHTTAVDLRVIGPSSSTNGSGYEARSTVRRSSHRSVAIAVDVSETPYGITSVSAHSSPPHEYTTFGT